jgi:hypothetical protein
MMFLYKDILTRTFQILFKINLKKQTRIIYIKTTTHKHDVKTLWRKHCFNDDDGKDRWEI